jgi:adenylate cyclase
MEAEGVDRRLAAILSADAVGYSRLMAEDEAGTIRTVTAHRKAMVHCIERERGRVVDAPGDNVLAEFPTALEALRCAVEIQGVLAQRNAELPAERRMPFRIGVHLGDVSAEGARLYGDGVNVAARMEAMAEPGGILISDLVLRQVRGKLDASFEDLGDKDLKNIPDPVRVYGVRVGTAAPAPAKSGSRRHWRTLAWAGAALLLAGLLVWAAWPRIAGLGVAGLEGPPTDPPLPAGPSLVVLPFANMSDDPAQEYFSDGITEDLTNALAGSRDLFVISRNSAFTYKSKQAKIEDIGRELGVRYVLEGSVRKVGERVRITAQLIDATTGFHQWSRQYDRELDDIFAVQSEISEQILGAVGARINEAELARIYTKPTDDLSAYDAYTRGSALFARYTRADLLEARKLLERSVELDPGFAAPHAMIGATYSAEYGLGYSFDVSLLDRALAKVEDAIRLDPGNPNAYTARASVHMQFPDREDRAIAAADKAIELAPSFSTPHIFRGAALARKGELSEGLASIRKAYRLDPRAASSPVSSGVLAGIYAASGQMDKAVELWVAARAGNPDLLNARLSLMDYYMSQGDEERAREVAAEVRSRHPDLTAELASEFVLRSRVKSADNVAMLANLRRAGLP